MTPEERARDLYDALKEAQELGAWIEDQLAIVTAAIKAALAEEREACAKTAEAHVICDWSGLSERKVDERFGKQIAAAIRERG